jgi:hypothetical protein
LDCYFSMYQFGTYADDAQFWLKLRGETNRGLDGALGIVGAVSTTRLRPRRVAVKVGPVHVDLPDGAQIGQQARKAPFMFILSRCPAAPIYASIAISRAASDCPVNP